jgi:predicted metal-dependent phosphoesterase TrpH
MIEKYIALGYSGIFVTNHFIDGNINVDRTLPYEDRIRFYFTDYEEAKRVGDELGFPVFCGVELSFGGTDFLVYGLDKDWFLAHPEIEGMKKSEELTLMKESGALIIQAHPYREASYIDHIRLFPRHVEGAEIINANASEFCNTMARHYADAYKLLPFAGSDIHSVAQKKLAGISTDEPISDVFDFIERIRSANYSVFSKVLD